MRITGLEPARFAAIDSKSIVSSIPPYPLMHPERFELSRSCEQRILSPLRLPIPSWVLTKRCSFCLPFRELVSAQHLFALSTLQD